MAKIENVNRLLAKLRGKEQQARRDNASVIVGYTAAYAVYVHENLEAFHPVGQAKFLESAAREFAREITALVRTAYLRTRNLGQALLLGGLRLQREAQLRTPVDTGALRASAFTRKE